MDSDVKIAVEIHTFNPDDYNRLYFDAGSTEQCR
jgi:hypothetical protein